MKISPAVLRLNYPLKIRCKQCSNKISNMAAVSANWSVVCLCSENFIRTNTWQLIFCWSLCFIMITMPGQVTSTNYLSLYAYFLSNFRVRPDIGAGKARWEWRKRFLQFKALLVFFLNYTEGRYLYLIHYHTNILGLLYISLIYLDH